MSSALGILALLAAAASISLALPRSKVGSLQRLKRTTEHIIRDCMLVTSEPGHYFYKAIGEDPTVCGVYLMTDPDKIIQLQFDYLDLPCNSGGLVSFVDGWELNGGYFPEVGEHRLRLEDRVTEFCGLSRPSRVFVSSQNAALVQYRVPKRSRGFSFRVSFLKNPTPCNVLVEGLEDVYTIRNYGKATNCSLTTLFPAQLSILSLSVGVSFPGDSFKIETGTMRKCEESGLKDYVEISGGLDLATPKLTQGESLCGIDSYPVSLSPVLVKSEPTFPETNSWESDYGWESYVDTLLGEQVEKEVTYYVDPAIEDSDKPPIGDSSSYTEVHVLGPLVETVLCGIATVKLVSSGDYDNSVTVAVRQATEQDLLSPTIICPL